MELLRAEIVCTWMCLRVIVRVATGQVCYGSSLCRLFWAPSLPP